MITLHLSGAGLVCPLGRSAAASCAALRAGIVRFHELPYWDRDRLPVVGAAVPHLSPGLQFGPRLVEMLTQALRDCMSSVPRSDWQEVPLLVGLAEPDRPGGGGELAEWMMARVQNALGIQFHASLSSAIPSGHTAGFEALRRAREILSTEEVAGCLVCGVDSYLNASTLWWLDQHWRLKRENNSDGVVPGEAAAVVYVGRQAVRGGGRRTQVVGFGAGQESAPLLSERPLLGLGLAKAMREAIAEAGWGFHEIDFRLSDVTGENYGFRELALAEARLVRVVRREGQPLWHVAEMIGDTGAAAGVIQLALASAAWSRSYAPGPQAVALTSSLRGERAAVALRCTPD